MRAIKRARKFIEREPSNPVGQTLAKLLLALETEQDFPINDLYLLDYDRFNLAVQIIREWRIDRYYAGRARLFDSTMQMAEFQHHVPQ